MERLEQSRGRQILFSGTRLVVFPTSDDGLIYSDPTAVDLLLGFDCFPLGRLLMSVMTLLLSLGTFSAIAWTESEIEDDPRIPGAWGRGVVFDEAAGMANRLLLELASCIYRVRQQEWAALAIADICLDNLFVSIRLNDGSVGAAMNYDLEGAHSITYAQVDQTRRELLERLQRDPLLWEYLRQPSDSLGRQALFVALLSALSAPKLLDVAWLDRQGWSSTAQRISLRSFQHLKPRTVTVVGFGGFLEEALAQDWLEQVNCIDFLANDPEFQRINPYPFELKDKAKMQVIYDDGTNGRALIDESDIVCISASTLCNGSLESLLPSPRDRRIVILEGPSGGVLPGPLFERGVTHLVHNPVDIDFVQMSHRYSRQARQGLQKVTSGRFIDILLPEQRTISSKAAGFP